MKKLILISTFALGAFFLFSLQAKTNHVPFIPELTFDQKGLILAVVSNGCTKKKDFAFDFTTEDQLTIRRKKPDYCRARPHRVKFYYTYTELGINPPRY